MAKAKTPKFAVYCNDTDGLYFYGHATSKTGLKQTVKDARAFVNSPMAGAPPVDPAIQVFELIPVS